MSNRGFKKLQSGTESKRNEPRHQPIIVLGTEREKQILLKMEPTGSLAH